MGSCVGAQSPQLLRVFFLVTIFTVRNLWSWPECVWHPQATWESSPVTKRNVLRALNHRQSQGGARSFSVVLRLGLSCLKRHHCVPAVPQRQIYTWKASICWYIIWKNVVLVSDKLMGNLSCCLLSAFFPLFCISVFCSCWWWGAWHCFIYFSINSFFTKYTCFLSYFFLLFQKLGRREHWKEDLVPFLSAIINLKIHSPVHHRAMIHPEVPCNQCKFNWILHLF